MALRVSIGQYYSANSPIHRLDPRTKFVAAAAYMVSCFCIHGPVALAFAGAVLAIVIRMARVPLPLMLRQVRPIMIFVLVTALINIFFVQTGDVLAQLGPIRIFSGGLQSAVLYGIRFLLLLLSGSLLMLTTTPTVLCDGIELLFRPLERIGVPVGQLALIMSIALRFVPTLASETENILVAQTARGAGIEGKGPLAYARACVPIVVPLFASALRHADNLGRAMDARCYTGDSRRTHYHELRLQREDRTFLMGAAAYLAVLAALIVLL